MDVVAVREAGTANAAREKPRRAGRLSRSELLFVVAVTVASVAANFFDLGSRSLWLDEIHSALLAVHHGTSLWSAITADGGNMLIYYGLLHAFVLVLHGQFVFVSRQRW